MIPNVPITGGPYLSAALFCEKILRESDGVMSFIRVVDRWTVSGPSETMPNTTIQTNLIITMKSGMYRGPSQIIVTPSTPSGSDMAALRASVNFEGDDDRGVAIHLPLVFPVQEPGIYWFEVSVNGQTQAQVPMRVLYQSVGVQTPNPANPGSPLT